MAGRAFLGVLYPESESYIIEDVLQTIREYFCKWAYIVHDCDLAEDGSLKKVHIHWVGRLEYPVDLSTVANRLCVPSNSIEYCKQWKASVRYLVHDANPEKTQYLVGDVSSNFDLLPLLGSHDEANDFGLILDFLSVQQAPTVMDMSRWAYQNGLYACWKHNFMIFKEIVLEKRKGFVK